MQKKKKFVWAVFALVSFVTAGSFLKSMKAATAAPIRLKNHRLFLLDTTVGEKRITTAGDVELLFDRKAGRILFGERWEGSATDTEDAGGSLLRLMRADGSGEQAVTDGPVRAAFFDRPGKTIYYTTVNQDLYALNADLSGRKLLAEKALGANLSPDGRRVVYQKLNADWKPGQLYDQALGLTVLDLASGAERRITASWEDFTPLWTPDGRSILFFSRSPEGLASHFLIKADGTGRRQMTNIGQQTVTDETVPIPSELPAWSADGQKLIYESDREIWLNEFSPKKDRLTAARSIGYGKHPEWANGGSVRVLMGNDGESGNVSGEGVDFASTVRIGLDGSLLK
jgi:hypothetical protein